MIRLALAAALAAVITAAFIRTMAAAHSDAEQPQE